MKSLLASVAAILALSLSLSAQAPIGPGAVVISKIEPQDVKTPQYNITGGPQKRSDIGTWLEIEVEFETKAPEISELTFQYMVMLNNQLVTGSVTHINIPKGRARYSVMYIAPRTLEKLNGGKAFTKGSIQNVWITVTGPNGVVIAKEASPKKVEPPNVAQLPGMVLNKAETPFAPLFFDRYEAIKPAK